jgi:hypothetical protein
MKVPSSNRKDHPQFWYVCGRFHSVRFVSEPELPTAVVAPARYRRVVVEHTGVVLPRIHLGDVAQLQSEGINLILGGPVSDLASGVVTPAPDPVALVEGAGMPIPYRTALYAL